MCSLCILQTFAVLVFIRFEVYVYQSKSISVNLNKIQLTLDLLPFRSIFPGADHRLQGLLFDTIFVLRSQKTKTSNLSRHTDAATLCRRRLAG